MTMPQDSPMPSRPRWDGVRILFGIIDGGEEIPCAISRAALEDISGARCFKTPDVLASFAKARSRIEAAAIAKLRARPEAASGRLNLWADDVEDMPQAGAPAASA